MGWNPLAQANGFTTRMIAMFTRTAVALRKTLESIATPCSVKAYGV
jgi:hypothetical protein